MEPRTLGRYEILAELGKGAMGVVYRATDPLLNRTVAIKTVNMSQDPEEMAEYEARFYQEAKAAGGLNHPNIVTIYDIGKSGNVIYMAMELLDGAELRALMKAGAPIAPARAVEIAAQVAEGLAFAHHHGVVHRDVKPANIMILGSGAAKITDFGIARMRTAEVRTQTGVVLGSPRYMSPEQVAGKRAEPRSDIFSLGVILYEMLTGKPAFTGEDVTSVMFQILNVVPPPPSAVNPAVPAVLDFIVAKALAKVADDRYQDAGELARDLSDSAKQVATTAQAPAAVLLPAQPTLDTEAALAVVRSLPGERRADAESPAAQSTPALGLSKAFDSLEATVKLAAQTGMTEALKDYPATPAGSATEARAIISEMRRGPGWSTTDRLIFAAGVAGATIIGAIIVLA
ncbi:MAG: serine/threonine protein kinase [Betaproteobacteria bacterium]|nr:serine/threonine protein kinase [Betaproteobacteria bacterium]